MHGKMIFYGTGNYSQYPVIIHNGKEYEEKKTHLLISDIQQSDSVMHIYVCVYIYHTRIYIYICLSISIQIYSFSDSVPLQVVTKY